MTNDTAWTNAKPHIKEVVLRDHETVEFRVKAVTNQPLRATICWTDPPGREQPYSLNPTNIVLVNDLDLRVISPNGCATNQPWVLDPTNPAAPATTGDNIRDNVEQVHISNPTSGWYTVRISHKGTLVANMQDVSVIITGNVPAPELAFTNIFLNASNNVEMTWNTAVGGLYRMESSTNLIPGVWIDDFADDISATKESMSWVNNVHTGASDRVRFYRVKAIE